MTLTSRTGRSGRPIASRTLTRCLAGYVRVASLRRADICPQARRDLEQHAGALSYDDARRVCWSALYAVFWEEYDAEDGPPPTEQPIPVELAAFGQFAPHPSNLERYGLAIYQAAVGNILDDREVNSSLRDWCTKHQGSPEEILSRGGKGLRGLPPFPPGYQAPRPPTVTDDGWKLVVELNDAPSGCGLAIGPVGADLVNVNKANEAMRIIRADCAMVEPHLAKVTAVDPLHCLRATLATIKRPPICISLYPEWALYSPTEGVRLFPDSQRRHNPTVGSRMPYDSRVHQYSQFQTTHTFRCQRDSACRPLHKPPTRRR